VKKKSKPTDTELLDYLQHLTDQKCYTGRALLRDSRTGRGWRLTETSDSNAVPDVRQAIADYMKKHPHQ
jgi:hypothetical protein